MFHKKRLKKLIKTFEKSSALGKTKPDFIDVGYFIFTPEKFEFTTYERFKL